MEQRLNKMRKAKTGLKQKEIEKIIKQAPHRLLYTAVGRSRLNKKYISITNNNSVTEGRLPMYYIYTIALIVDTARKTETLA